MIYKRLSELSLLHNFKKLTATESKLVLITGRRKVGKTLLVSEHLRLNKGAYILISPKATIPQLKNISDYLKSFNFGNTFVPTFQNWKEFFDYIFHIAKNNPLTVVLDEVHNFDKLDSSIYYDLKSSWLENYRNSSLLLIMVSHNSQFVKKTFFEPESPLLHLENLTLTLKPYLFRDVISIFRSGTYRSLSDIAGFYLVFGGLPKYYSLIESLQLKDRDIVSVLNELLFKEFSPLTAELKELISFQFGREHQTYISILEKIALGTSRMSDIARETGIPVTSVSKYLNELDKRFGLIKRRVPIYEEDPARSKNGKYFISDYFMNFWFSFVQQDEIRFEFRRYDKILQRLRADLPLYIENRYHILVKELFKFGTYPEFTQNIFPHEIKKIGSMWNRKAFTKLAVIGDDKSILLGRFSTKNLPVNSVDLEYFNESFECLKADLPDYKVYKLIVTKSGLAHDSVELARRYGIEHIEFDKILMSYERFDEIIQLKGVVPGTNIPLLPNDEKKYQTAL